jgi:hypothetical protein
LDKNIKEKIEYEISQINKLFSEGKPLLDLCKYKELDFIEKSAAGSFLHSFYNGIENLILMIFKSIPENIPNDTHWHKRLLDKSFESTEKRQPLFNKEYKKQLENYLNFRHLFRHTYEYQINPILLKPLINEVGIFWEKLERDIYKFVEEFLNSLNAV